MSDELKSMFRQGEMTAEEMEEKEKYDSEMHRKREFNRKQKKNTKWTWSSFSNQARKDELKLNHWIKKDDSNIQKDYEYAQYNKKISIIEFNKYEYETFLKNLDDSWSFEETLYLWDLCKIYDLRFIIITDRYDEKYNRTIEELKQRYYTIAKILLEHRKDFDHPILKSGYNYEQEIKRRACLEKIISKTKEDISQENKLLKQTLEVERRIEKYENFEKEIKNLSDENTNNLTFEDFIKSNAGQLDSFVYLRSNKMKYNLPVSEKIQKKVESLLRELQVPEKLVPTNSVEQAYDNLRNNLIILTSLRKHLDKKEREFIKLNHINNEIANKFHVKSTGINLGNIGNGNSNNNSSIPLVNLNSSSGNVNLNNINLSLHEENDNISTGNNNNVGNNISNKEKSKKNLMNLQQQQNINTNLGNLNLGLNSTGNNLINNLNAENVNVNRNKLIRKVK